MASADVEPRRDSPAGEQPPAVGPTGQGTPARAESPSPGETPPDQAARGSFAREAARKLIHLAGSVAAALLAWTLPTGQRRALFLAVAAFAVAFDLGRLTFPGLRRHFERALAPMLRGAERHRISGATTLALGFALAVVLFPRTPAVAGLLYAGCGDAAGALVGRALGRHRFPWGRSLEGSLAVLVVSFLLAWTVPGLSAPAALAIAVAVTILEAAPLPFDDNLLLPAAAAALTFLLSRGG